MKKKILGLLTASCVTVTSAANADELENLAKGLAELRGDVEALYDELERNEAALAFETQSLERQKSELLAEVQREELRGQQMRRLLDKQRAQVQASDEVDSKYLPSVMAGIETLRERIKSGLPFRVEDRLRVLDDIAAEANAGHAIRAATKLWAAIEDELRLTKESGLDKQVIHLEGSDVLVDTLRIGMVGLFFKAEPNRVGYLQRDGDGWLAVVIEDREGQKAVFELFEAFRRQIKSGAFVVPSAALPKAGVKR